MLKGIYIYINVGFIIGTNSYAELTTTTVYTGKMNALVYEGHPFYDCSQLSIEDLKDQPLITLNNKYSSFHSLIQRCGDFGFSPDIGILTMSVKLYV